MACGGCRGPVKVQTDRAETIKAPTMDPDGSMRFPRDKPVPVVEGYHPDPEDQHHLIPDEDANCLYKITGILLQKDGSYQPHHVCRKSDCEHYTKAVTPDICKACPLREQG